MNNSKSTMMYIQVPDLPSENEFLNKAKQLWRERHQVIAKKRGRPSVAQRVFETCDYVALGLLRFKSAEQKQFHEEHLPKDKKQSAYHLITVPSVRKKAFTKN